jgi:hypothetical protein
MNQPVMLKIFLALVTGDTQHATACMALLPNSKQMLYRYSFSLIVNACSVYGISFLLSEENLCSFEVINDEVVDRQSVSRNFIFSRCIILTTKFFPINRSVRATTKLPLQSPVIVAPFSLV